MLYFDYQINISSELFSNTYKKVFFTVRETVPFEEVVTSIEKYYTFLLGKKPIMSIKMLHRSH